MSEEQELDHEWEKCKENIKPLKGGRRMGEVLAALNKDSSHAKKKIEDFEMQLRVLEDEDLLNVWFDYVCWTQQHFISSSNETLNVMKRCVKHFKNKIEFRNYEKFVKIWIKISELTIEAEDIFMYMFDQDIGTTLTIFYKAWALHHEIMGNTQRADEIFLLGINRKADPIDVLKQSHSEFEWRMAKKKMEKNDEGEDEEDGIYRAPLNKLASTKSGKVNSKRNRVKLQEITSTVSGASSGNNRKCSSASVFEILDDRNIKDDILPTSTLFSAKTGKLTKLPFNDNKENALAVEKIKHTKIKTKTTIPSTSKTQFLIYKDDTPDVGADDVFSSPVTFNLRKPLDSITSEVLKSENVDMLQDLEQDPNDAKAIPMYPKDKVYMGINEVSLEELLAQLQKYRKQ